MMTQPEGGALAAGLTLPELAIVLQRVSEGVILRDAGLNVRYVNDAAKRILGIRDTADVDPEPLESWDIFDEHGQPAELPIRDVVTAGVSWQDRLFEVRRTGQPSQWLRSTAAPIILADGSRGALSLFTDVSADHQARRQAEQNEEYFRLIADNATDVMWRNDRDSALLWISPSVTRVLGWSPGELVGRTMVDVVHPEDRSEALRARAAALAGQRASAEIRLQRADGTWCPMGVRAGPFRDADRHIVGTFAAARDITRERLSQHQVEGSERRFRMLADLGERLQLVTGANDVAQAAADFVAGNVGDGVVVSRLEAEDMRVVAVAHPDGRGEQLLAALTRLGPIPLPMTLSAGVVATGRTLQATSPDPGDHVDDSLAGYHGEFGGASVVIVPLAAYGTVIGTMTVTRDEGHVPLGARDRDLVEEIASRTALAIHDGILRERAADAERQYRLIADSMSDVVTQVDDTGVIAWVSPSVQERYGWRPEELLGTSLFDLVAAEQHGELTAALTNLTPTTEHRLRLRHRDGRITWVSAVAADVRGESTGGRVLSLHDRDAEIRAKDSLETSERLFRLAMRQSPVGMALVGLDGQWLEVNDALATMTGYEPEELLHLTFQDISHPDDLDADLVLFEQLLAGQIPDYRIHKRYVRRDGASVWIELRVSLVRSVTGEPLYVVGQMVDLDAAASDPQPGRRGPRDQITGLVHRPVLMRALSLAMTDQRRPGSQACVCVCDIDGFSDLNDRLGRAAGNLVLHETADRISGRIRAGDSVARVGADEFAVLLSTLHSADEAAVVADQLRAVVAEPMDVPGAEPIQVTICVGVAAAPIGTDPETVMARAFRMLDRAKTQGRDTLVIEATG